MKKKTAFLAAATVSMSLICSQGALAKKHKVKMEKCYGVAKAGKNDCASAVKGRHSCAGNQLVDGDKTSFIVLRKGTCERLVNGTLDPVLD